MTTGTTQRYSRRYSVDQLIIGMFVSSVDRPMRDTPFPLDGFYIRTREELLELSKHCNHVVVNIAKSKLAHDVNTALQMEVLDIPEAISNPTAFKQRQSRRPAKPIKPRHKGRVKRLFILLGISLVVLHYL